MLGEQPEVFREDLPAGGRVGYQPPGLRQVSEGGGDDVAQGVQVRPLPRSAMAILRTVSSRTPLSGA